jgi:tetratricopeptide (TPR) repeat protein
MARADRRREQRAKAAAVPRRSEIAIEDTMFFPRLRRHAKWMFLLLALAFALGFIGFGVGAGGVGVGDILSGSGGGSGVPSVSEAQKKVFENPKDAKAFRDLANAYQAKGDTAGAIDALESYSGLKPRNTAVLRELAGLYLTKASDAQQRAQILQYRQQYLAPGAMLATAYQLGDKVFNPDPITNAVSSGYDDQISAAYSELQDASRKAVGAYQKIVIVQPKDPAIRLELGQAAQAANDKATAIAAYEAFLRLAPDDPTVPEVKRLLKQLRASSSTG